MNHHFVCLTEATAAASESADTTETPMETDTAAAAGAEGKKVSKGDRDQSLLPLTWRH